MTTLKQYLFKKTKIVGTIGPASENTPTLIAMINKGLNIARLNCSHGDHPTLGQWIKNIRAAEKKTGVPIPIMIDLQGPKIRIGAMEGGKPVKITSGQNLVITTQPILGTKDRVSTGYTKLPQAVHIGDDIFINDGIVHLRVLSKTQDEIVTVVKTGGFLSNFKGINVPRGDFKRKGLSVKDKADIDFGIRNNVEAIAVSFVERAQHLREIKKYLGNKAQETLIIAKIEKPDAVKNIDEILDEADGVMIARGDLGVEISLEKVPVTQKEIIQRAMEKNRLTIVATQMLESMMHGPRPTRAEVSDVANSILDETDSLMLSAETAMGEYPKTAVKMMSKISLEIEKNQGEGDLQIRKRLQKVKTKMEAMVRSAVSAAYLLNLEKIVVFTQSGLTARHLSLRRPNQIIIAFSHSLRVRRQMQFFHGVYPVEIDTIKTLEDQYRQMETIGKKYDLWKTGETLMVLSGPLGITGGTNLLKVHTVGE